jgi:hypothetical protein
MFRTRKLIRIQIGIAWIQIRIPNMHPGRQITGKRLRFTWIRIRMNPQSVSKLDPETDPHSAGFGSALSRCESETLPVSRLQCHIVRNEVPVPTLTRIAPVPVFICRSVLIRIKVYGFISVSFHIAATVRKAGLN